MSLEVPTPEFDPDEEISPYKRRVALLVVAITFFASIVGYLQTASSNNEDEAARDAHLQAITGLGEQVNASAEFGYAYDVYTQAQIFDRRRFIAQNRRRFATGEDEQRFALEAKRWAEVRDGLTALSPLLANEEYTADSDPLFPTRYDSELGVTPDIAQLKQAAQAEESDDWGSKADSYVAVLTVLAGGLFLIGLSLTVGGRGRILLVTPGVGLASVCVLWTGLIYLADVAVTPDSAIAAVAEGDRLLGQGKHDEAIAAYDEAIAIRSDYAAAFAARAEAKFVGGSSQNATYISVTSPESLQGAIDDAQTAIDLGGDSDYAVVGSLAFYYFVAGDYEAAYELTVRSLNLNNRVPEAWLNLGLIEAARGNLAEAERVYGIAIERIEAQPDAFTRSDLFAAARTDLEILALQQPDNPEVVAQFERQLTLAQMGQSLPDGVVPAGADAQVTVTSEQDDGSYITLYYDVVNIDAGDGLGFVWYFRPDATQPFTQIVNEAEFTTFEPVLEGEPTSFEQASTGCLAAGEYRVDVYGGQGVITTYTYEVDEPALGSMSLLYDEDLGVQICKPDDWTEKEDGDDTLAISDERDASVDVSVYALGDEVMAEGVDGLVDQVLEIFTAGSTLALTPADATEATIGGLTGKLLPFEFDGKPGSVFAAVGDDTILRLVISTGADADQLAVIDEEVVPTLLFVEQDLR